MLRILGLAVLLVTVYGCAPMPASLVTRGSTDFGQVPVGTTASRASGATWRNTGEKSGRITGLELAGSEAPAFTSDPRTMMGRVRPGEQTQPVTAVTFAPFKRGAHLATLTPRLAEQDATANGVMLRGQGEYVYSENTLTVLEPSGALPDPDKPLDCGRTQYGTSVTCTFTVRNDAQTPANVFVIVLTPLTPAAFGVTGPLPTPPAPTVPIAPGASQTITLRFAPPNQVPVETLFTGGILVTTGSGNSSARALCGVGFRTLETPPAPGTIASLACP